MEKDIKEIRNLLRMLVILFCESRWYPKEEIEKIVKQTQED